MRWTDCGLGDNWRDVYQATSDLAGPYVLAHHMVISPAPDLMALVPEDLRQEIVRKVTERTIEQWHIERGLAVPEYSFVLHDRDTDEDQLQQLHTHIFVAGTIDNGLGERISHRVGKNQVVADTYALTREDNLHRIARDEFEQILDRTIGLDWYRLREAERVQDEVDHAPISDLTEIDL